MGHSVLICCRLLVQNRNTELRLHCVFYATDNASRANVRNYERMQSALCVFDVHKLLVTSLLTTGNCYVGIITTGGGQNVWPLRGKWKKSAQRDANTAPRRRPPSQGRRTAKI